MEFKSLYGLQAPDIICRGGLSHTIRSLLIVPYFSNNLLFIKSCYFVTPHIEIITCVYL